MTNRDSSDASVLDYHLPSDTQFSLSHVTDDREAHNEERDRLRAVDGTDVQTREEDLAGKVAYLIYTNEAPDGVLADFDTEEEILDWIRSEFSTDDLQIVLAVFRGFRGVLDEREATADTLTLYKQMELERIPDIVNRVEWRQPVPEVAADLLSTFVLVHPMPNTNHRTGISLLDRYLTAMDPSFKLPDTGVDGEWFAWARDYIYASKRLLTLRRNLYVFGYAADIGYERVRRKEGIEIGLIDIDFETATPESYARKHRNRTREFVDTLLTEAGATHLQGEIDDRKRAFVDRLRADQ